MAEELLEVVITIILLRISNLLYNVYTRDEERVRARKYS